MYFCLKPESKYCNNELITGYETRSRRSMTEMNIEELEQQYIPFDITPDMYDIPCDNDDYSEFLKTLYSGSNSKQRYAVIKRQWVPGEFLFRSYF